MNKRMSGTGNKASLYLRIALSAVVLVILVVALRASATAGFARLLARYADSSADVDAAHAASQLSAGDAETHFMRGAVFEAKGDFRAAAEEYTNAARLRPDDYVLWLALAHVREITNNPQGAVAAAKQAVTLAPHYAPPRWQLGNTLIRGGRVEEGFRELREAGESDFSMWPAIIDLAWQLSSGDVEFVKRAVQPKSPESYKALADYFKKRDHVTEALEMFRSAGTTTPHERSVFIGELIAARKFNEAATLWGLDHQQDQPGMAGKLHNPGFEDEGNLDEPGFNWFQDNKAKTLAISLDLSQPKEGRSSLRVDFNGESEPNLPVISQLVLVEPNTRYQLGFAARTKDLVSGGLAYFAVTDRTNNVQLGQASVFPRQSEWQEYELEFTTGEKVSAIQLMVRRIPCTAPPCPIFGHLWLDSFVLQKFPKVAQ